MLRRKKDCPRGTHYNMNQLKPHAASFVSNHVSGGSVSSVYGGRATEAAWRDRAGPTPMGVTTGNGNVGFISTFLFVENAKCPVSKQSQRIMVPRYPHPRG